MTRSLQSRLLAGTLGASALLLALFGFVVYLSLRHAFMQEFDTFLTTTVHTLAAAIEVEHGRIEVDYNPPRFPRHHNTGRPVYYEFWSQNGTALGRSASLGDAELPMFFGEQGNPEIRPVALPGGRPGRAAGILFEPGPEWNGEHDGPRPVVPPLVLVVAGDTSDLHARVRSLGRLLLAAWAASMAAALLVSVVIAGRGLKPLKGLASRIAAIREDDLTERIRLGSMPTELAPVVERLNGLLARLHEAFVRERTLTADVAHELRTPLAGVRSTIEVALSRARPPAEYREALEDCLGIALGMQSLIESLLTLASLDSGQLALRRERVALRPLIEDCWRPLSSAAESRAVRLDNGVPEELSCLGDEVRLRTVFANVLENACEYSSEGGSILVRGKREGGRVEVAVSNPGCRLGSDACQHVFERFWRADRSRTDTGLHAGLGLALVERIVSSLGGTATVNVDPAGLFTILIALPALNSTQVPPTEHSSPDGRRIPPQ